METYAKSLGKSYEVMDIANFNRTEGRKEGEKRTRILIASKLLQKNMPIDDVISFTGLTRKQIQELLK